MEWWQVLLIVVGAIAAVYVIPFVVAILTIVVAVVFATAERLWDLGGQALRWLYNKITRRS